MDFASNFEDAVKIVNEKKMIEYANTTKMKMSSNGRIFWILLGIKVFALYYHIMLFLEYIEWL